MITSSDTDGADQILHLAPISTELSTVLVVTSAADIVRLGGGMAYFATRRGYDSFRNMPGISDGGDELFDLNSLAPDEILAIEVYKGGATMPLEYDATRKTCGLLVIFTK
ncbi:hypothetical protein [Gemmatimonas sp.]|uniref:hypothetical protein n=1 Tax=Gemmatimonas sp. TaxID=1962908 RepID=UPI00286CBDB8|nr:hypothetical protein [Gemmatimonas sp.]